MDPNSDKSSMRIVEDTVRLVMLSTTSSAKSVMVSYYFHSTDVWGSLT